MYLDFFFPVKAQVVFLFHRHYHCNLASGTHRMEDAGAHSSPVQVIARV